jgi:hypothetical protein
MTSHVRLKSLCELVDFALKYADRRNVEPLILGVKQIVIGIRLVPIGFPGESGK